MNSFLTTRQACEILEIDAVTLWRWANKGLVEKYKNPKNGHVRYKIQSQNFYRIDDVCEKLNVCRRTLERLRKSGNLVPVINDGYIIRYSVNQIDEYMQNSIDSFERVN